MRGVVGAIAAIAAAAVTFCVEAASAQGADDAHYLLFSGIDLWRNGGFGHGGLLWSRDGLTQDGFTLKVLLGAGAYRYNAGGVDIVGRQYVASVLPGWRFKQDGLDITVFAGLDLQEHQLLPDDPGNRVRGFHAGLRGGFDVWFEPIPATVMFTGSVSASTVGTNVWARAAAGLRTFDLLWLGPEFIACGDETYRQFRVGLHATGLRTGAFEWSLGAGWVQDSDKRNGAYGRLGFITRR